MAIPIFLGIVDAIMLLAVSKILIVVLGLFVYSTMVFLNVKKIHYTRNLLKLYRLVCIRILIGVVEEILTVATLQRYVVLEEYAFSTKLVQ
jgi:hypothetical protein